MNVNIASAGKIKNQIEQIVYTFTGQDNLPQIRAKMADQLYRAMMHKWADREVDSFSATTFPASSNHPYGLASVQFAIGRDTFMSEIDLSGILTGRGPRVQTPQQEPHIDDPFPHITELSKQADDISYDHAMDVVKQLLNK